MDFDFGLFEKAKEIYSAVRKLAWSAVSVTGGLLFAAWHLVDYVADRAVSLIEWISKFFPEVTVNMGSVGLDWSRINQFVPVNEAITYLTIWMGLAGAMVFLRMMKKVMPWS